MEANTPTYAEIEFNSSVDEFFELAFKKVEKGEMTTKELGSLFPDEVKERNKV